MIKTLAISNYNVLKIFNASFVAFLIPCNESGIDEQKFYYNDQKITNSNMERKREQKLVSFDHFFTIINSLV